MDVPTLREFIRRVWREAAAQSVSRDAYLDGLADAALDAQNEGGQLLSVSHQAGSVSYQPFTGWSPGRILSGIDFVRALTQHNDVDDALSDITETFSTRPNFAGGRTWH